MLLKLSFYRRTKVMRVGLKASTSPPLSAEHWEYHVSTMEDLSFDPVNFGQLPTTLEQHEENSPQSYRHCSFTCCWLVFTSCSDESPVRPQHSSTDASSPATGVQIFHHQSIITSTITTHSHKTWSSSTQISIKLHGMMIQLPLRKTSQQHPWMKKCGLKIQFQMDTCASTKHLTSQTTSVPTPVHTTPQPSGWTYHSLHHRVPQCLTTN